MARLLIQQRRYTNRVLPRRAASCRLNSGPNPAGDRGAVEFAPRPDSADLFTTGAARARRIRITVNEAGHGTLRPSGC